MINKKVVLDHKFIHILLIIEKTGMPHLKKKPLFKFNRLKFI
jgi:hypothetical protein